MIIIDILNPEDNEKTEKEHEVDEREEFAVNWQIRKQLVRIDGTFEEE